MAEVYHALGLHMHQPLGNLVALHNSDESWEAKQILWCYDRVTRMLEGYEDIARLHMSFSGTLLKQLEDPGVRQTFGDVVDNSDFMQRYRSSNIEFVGSGLYHPFIHCRRRRIGMRRPNGGWAWDVICWAVSDSRVFGRRRWVFAWR